MQVDRRRVVITGLGVATPLGISIDGFWRGLLEGRSGVRTIEGVDVSQSRTRIGAQVAGYEPGQHFSRKELQRLSRATQLALVSAQQAITDSHLDQGGYDPQSVGIILGSSSTGCICSCESFLYRMLETGVPDPLVIPVSMNLAAAANISIRWGFKGPSMTLDAACSSATHAIGYAYNLIRFGLVSAVVTGGAESPFAPFVLQAWSSTHALSERNDTPSEACRPFSLDRDGMVLGEHAGILILENETSALQREARIYGEIRGYGATSDAFHITQPTVEGPVGAMKLALADAGLCPHDIDYINAHGTGTPLNDKTESAAIKSVFGQHAYNIPVVGIKAAIGHSLAASGAVELISCVLSIRDGVVPPTLNVVVPDPECDLDYVPEGNRRCDVSNVLKNSFAFGGSNAAVVVSRYS